MDFLKAQFTKIPRIAPVNLSASTVIVTGANVGIGFETAREILHSKPQRLILAVRSLEKGNAARRELEKSKSGTTRLDVRLLDQSSFESVRTFVKELEGERVDIAILNTGVINTKFTVTPDGNEADLQVNVLAPALLSLLLLPNLRLAASASRPNDAPKAHLTIVSSGLHAQAKFVERKAPDRHILGTLNDPQKYVQSDRYPTSKAIGLLWTRELASKVSSSEIVINAPTPGFCKTDLMRNTGGVMQYVIQLTMALIGRSATDGARCIVDAALVKGPESHGYFLSETNIKAESALVRSEEGQKLQGMLWNEILDAFRQKSIHVEGVVPGL